MKNLYKSLAEFQQAVPVIHQNTKGYGYTYADLNAIFKTIKPLLKEHGLGFTQLLDGENLKTIIFHIDSGESIESSVHIQQNVTLAKMNTFQVLGSAITYYRRYSLSAALGLITDADIDAAGEQKPTEYKKVTLNIDSKEWASALDYLKKGGNIKDIEKKYSISDANREELMNNAI